jgi:4-carboxymuconolactone decarboxylase
VAGGTEGDDVDETTDAWDRGVARYREVYGEDAFAYEKGQSGQFDVLIEHLFDGVWNREGLSIAERRLVTIGVLAAQHHFDTLGMQFERAMATGELDEQQVRELVIHLAAYVGYPSSSPLVAAGEGAIARARKAAAGE